MRLGLTQIPLHSPALVAPPPEQRVFLLEILPPPFPPLVYPFLPGPLFLPLSLYVAEGAIAAAAVFGLWSQRGGFFGAVFLLRSGKRRVGLGPSLAAAAAAAAEGESIGNILPFHRSMWCGRGGWFACFLLLRPAAGGADGL